MQLLAVWLLYQLPEAVMMQYCGTRLLGLRPPRQRFLLASLLFAVAVPLARLLPFRFGVHTVILFGVYAAIFVLIHRVSLLTSLMSATLANILVILGDVVVIPVASALHLSIGGPVLSLPVTLLLGYSSASVLVLTTALVAVFRLRLITVPEALPSASKSAD